jgi:hypothetical protein
MRTIVVGWFSFEGMGATAGDFLAKDVVGEWLDQTGRSWDLATAPPFEGGVDWRLVDPSSYSRLIFVCGPFGDFELSQQLIERFAHCRMVGINLSMLQPLDQWNPFDALYERDSSARVRPDIALLSRSERVATVGIVLVDPQSEYGNRGRHGRSGAMIQELMASREAAIVNIDTRLDQPNRSGLRSPAEIETLIARMDLVVTTRLHGLVLALKNGVPAIAVDPIEGGAKITEQAAVLGWPIVFEGDRVSLSELEQAYAYCLTDEARQKAAKCADSARRDLETLKDAVLSEFNAPDLPEPSGLSAREAIIQARQAEIERSRIAARPIPRLRRVLRSAKRAVGRFASTS